MTHSFNEMKTLQTNVKLQLRHEIWLFSGEKPLFESTHLYECVDVVHESLSPANNELIHTRYGMRPTERVGIISMLFLIIKHGRCISERCVCVCGSSPDLGAAVFEELQEFGDHEVEGLIQSVTVQQFRRVLTDLLQRTERTLYTHTHILKQMRKITHFCWKFHCIMGFNRGQCVICSSENLFKSKCKCLIIAYIKPKYQLRRRIV